MRECPKASKVFLVQGRHRTIDGHYTVIPLADDGWDPIKDVKSGANGYSHAHNAAG